MISDRFCKTLLMLIPLLLLAGCMTTHDHLLDMNTSQVQLRNIQSRAFDTTDKEKTMRAIIATLQDLGFMLDRADYTLGVVTASKARADVMQVPAALRVTVTVRPTGREAAPGAGQCGVSAGTRHGAQAVPEFLQLTREGDVPRSPSSRLILFISLSLDGRG